MAEPLVLHEDRFFDDADSAVRRAARAMGRALAYNVVKESYRFTTTPPERLASEPETALAAAVSA